MKKLLILAVCLLAAVSAWASTPTPGGKPWESEEEGSTAVTRTVEYRIVRTPLLEERIEPFPLSPFAEIDVPLFVR